MALNIWFTSLERGMRKPSESPVQRNESSPEDEQRKPLTLDGGAATAKRYASRERGTVPPGKEAEGMETCSAHGKHRTPSPA